MHFVSYKPRCQRPDKNLKSSWKKKIDWILEANLVLHVYRHNPTCTESWDKTKTKNAILVETFSCSENVIKFGVSSTCWFEIITMLLKGKYNSAAYFFSNQHILLRIWWKFPSMESFRQGFQKHLNIFFPTHPVSCVMTDHDTSASWLPPLHYCCHFPSPCTLLPTQKRAGSNIQQKRHTRAERTIPPKIKQTDVGKKTRHQKKTKKKKKKSPWGAARGLPWWRASICCLPTEPAGRPKQRGGGNKKPKR